MKQREETQKILEENFYIDLFDLYRLFDATASPIRTKLLENLYLKDPEAFDFDWLQEPPEGITKEDIEEIKDSLFCGWTTYTFECFPLATNRTEANPWKCFLKTGFIPIFHKDNFGNATVYLTTEEWVTHKQDEITMKNAFIAWIYSEKVELFEFLRS